MALKKKVLIVDDSRAILAILRRVVEQVSGPPSPEVRTALSAQEALDMVGEFNPDLIITDWHMPGVSGIEMLQALRQTGHADVQVGFVTAETTPDRVAEAHSNGASFVLHKPFEDDALMAAIRGALAGQRPPPAPPRGDPPLQVEALERLLRVALKQVVFTLKGCEPLAQQDLTPFLLRCTYVQGDERVKVVGLLDYPALCIVGAGSGAASLEAAVAAIAKGRPDPEVVQRATTFMRVAAKLIKGHSEAQPYKLLNAQVVSRGVSELDALLLASPGRADMRLSAQGCSDGRVSFLRVLP